MPTIQKPHIMPRSSPNASREEKDLGQAATFPSICWFTPPGMGGSNIAWQCYGKHLHT